MRERFPVPAETEEQQARASDPRHSAWVSANAGSGKTHVLARRVVRLLLDGADPSRILCLTYTKAAAANMSNRVFRELAKWTALDDEALTREVEGMEGHAAGPGKVALARQLFARALETPGGLKIQTIHAFCEAVLHQFPLEANIAGHFEMLDSAMEAALVAEARRDMITGLAGGEPADLASAFGEVLARGGEHGLDLLLGEIVRQRDGLRAFFEAAGAIGVPHEALMAEFGLAEEDDAPGIAATAWPLPGFDPAGFAEFSAAAEQTGAAFVLNNILPDCRAAFAETDPLRRFQLLARGFLKSDGTAYDPEKSFRASLRARLPALAERYCAAAERLVAVRERLAVLDMVIATRAALTVADALIGRYERLKSARGFLDFNDLISRTIKLLARQDAGQWVQYRLDQGIDHILLDEAQDTSPDQWRVVRSLAEEFFAGVGSREGSRRTVFAVGDEKQSIYSFQGAEPDAFAEMRAFYRRRVADAELPFAEVRLRHSFRSTFDILAAVDRVFRDAANRRGLAGPDDDISHSAIRAGAPGYVELWPSIGASAAEEPEDWREAVDHAAAPAVLLAERIAATVAAWIASGERVEATGKPIRSGDVMVLVRKRDSFVHALSRALKNRQVPVAGADRLDLGAHIAVKDLVALGRFVLQPGDDLSLAALLRSPVFDLSEELLFDLAHRRGDTASLYDALVAAAPADVQLGRIADALRSWRDQADLLPVFEFYAAILGRDRVRERMLARLGHEAGEILDEFLSFCLSEERAGLPGLEPFLATLESASPEIKREMDQGRDEVRIMTVHAAKGLEAPVVFLVDSGGKPFNAGHLPRLFPFESRSGMWRGRGYLWRPAREHANAAADAVAAGIRDRAEAEYRRLLYVGMTRAEDRLLVCGYHGRRGQNEDAWHAVVDRALEGAPECIESADIVTGGTVRRYRITPHRAATGNADQPARIELPPMPPELRAELPPPPTLPRPLSPSGVSVFVGETPADEGVPGSPVLVPAAAASFAVERGIAIHRLLQMLPDIEPDRRAEAAGRYLARIGRTWPDGEREAALRSVAAVLADSAFAAVFAEGSRAEVAVMGTMRIGGRDHAVSAKVDRIAVTPEEVIVVDYKTGRVPAAAGDAGEGHVAQMALYRTLLRPLFPGRRVATALLYTEAPRLLRLPDTLLDGALAALGVEVPA